MARARRQVCQEAQPCQDIPSLRLIGRLLYRNIHRTSTPSSITSSPWLGFITTCLSETLLPSAETNRNFATPHYFLSHSKFLRRTRISPSNDNLSLGKRGGAASRTPKFRVEGICNSAMHSSPPFKFSRNHQSEILLVNADRALMTFLLPSFHDPRSLSLLGEVASKKCAVHCDIATIAQWCLERA